MKQFIKVLYGVLILSVILMVAGVASGATVESVFIALNDISSFEPHEAFIDVTFEDIKINAEGKNIDIVFSDSIEQVQINYYLKSNETLLTSTENSQTLEITHKKEDSIFNWFSFGYQPIKMQTIYIVLPITFMGNLEINNLAGNIYIKGKFENLKVDLSAGNLNIRESEITQNLDIDCAAGNITIIDTLINGVLKTTLNAGNLAINSTDASTYHVTVSAGNFNLALPLSETLYNFDLGVNFGNLKINGTNVGNTYLSGSGIEVYVRISAGNADIETAQ